MADIIHEDNEPEGDRRVIHEYRDSDRGVGDGLLAFLILVIILAAIGLVVWRYFPSSASRGVNTQIQVPSSPGSSSTGGGTGSGSGSNTGPANGTY